MTYSVMFGSDLFIGTTGILTVTDKDPSTGEDKTMEFFRIREIDRQRSSGSYLVIDCDIKDPDGDREIKLFKSRPVAGSPEVEVLNQGKAIEVQRANGCLIIKVEEVDSDTLISTASSSVVEALANVKTVLRITGDFQAGPYRVRADNAKLQIGGMTISGNVHVGGGIHLTPMGFMM